MLHFDRLLFLEKYTSDKGVTYLEAVTDRNGKWRFETKQDCSKVPVLVPVVADLEVTGKLFSGRREVDGKSLPDNRLNVVVERFSLSAA